MLRRGSNVLGDEAPLKVCYKKKSNFFWNNRKKKSVSTFRTLQWDEGKGAPPPLFTRHLSLTPKATDSGWVERTCENREGD